MGPNTLNNLPIHPLLVHFTVVLVPLSALLLVVSLCWPAAHRRLGIVTPAVALTSLVLVPLTTHAGEWLEHQTPHDPLVRIHAELGDQLIYWSTGVFLASLAWWVLHQPKIREWWNARRRPALPLVGRGLAVGIAFVGVILAVGSVVQVYRIGDSGAAAVWAHTTSTPTAQQGR